MPIDNASRLWRKANEAIAGQTRQRGEPSTSPIRRYTDPERHVAELVALRGLPHAIGPASRVRRPGDWFTAQSRDVPVLVTRGDDGRLRAFINVCRHRGAIVAPPSQCGAGKQRFVCPYHSWTYDCRGALVGRPHEADFPHVPRDAAALVALPVAVRCGLVWVVPKPVEHFEWDDYFGPLGAELEALGYDAAAECPHERNFEQASNWKLVFDANLESYHFQYAHRQTIAALFHDNLVQHQSFGHHQRIVLPKQSLGETRAEAVDWELLGRHSNIIYFYFPSTLLLWEGDHLNGFSIDPLSPNRCHTRGWLIAPAALHARRDPAHWQRNFELFWRAIDEDFALAASIESGLASGANTELRFGANEFACDLFERAVDSLLA